MYMINKTPTRAIVTGLLKSFPPCMRNPHGVVESWRSNFASNVNTDIIWGVFYSTIIIIREWSNLIQDK